MAYMGKTWTEITQRIVSRIVGLTDQLRDWNVGGKTRSIVESVAMEIEDIHATTQKSLLDAIGTATYRNFDFRRLQPAAAFGYERFTSDEPTETPILIPEGTLVVIPETDMTYATEKDATIPIGETYVEVKVVATRPGTSYRALAYTITELKTPINGVDSVTNPEAFTTGRNEETDQEMKVRFQSYISTLARGIKTAIAYGAKTAQLLDDQGRVQEYVVDAVALDLDDDPTIQPCTTRCYIYNGEGGTSPELIAECQKIIDGYYDEHSQRIPGYKAAGCIVEVLPVVEMTVNVDMVLTVIPGYQTGSVVTNVTTAITNYLSSLGIGRECLLAEITRLAKQVQGVYNVSVEAPDDDVTPDRISVVIPGYIAVTVES